MLNLFESSKDYKSFYNNLSESKLSHAYLILSCDSLNNSLFANKIAQLILCDNKNACNVCPSCLKLIARSHPDVLIYPKGKTFIVDDAMSLGNHIVEKPMLGEKKVVIINNIDEGTVQAQNKILKSLEEPPLSTIFILTATNENKILPTIISRTRKIILSPVDLSSIKAYIEKEKPSTPTNLLKQALEYGDGWIGKTLSILENEDFESAQQLAHEIVSSFSSSKLISTYSSKVLYFRPKFKEFLEILSREFSKILSKNKETSVQGIIEIIDAINLANQSRERNVNLNLIVDNLLMKILEIKYHYNI